MLNLADRQVPVEPLVVTREEAAERLRVSVRTIDRYIESGVLPKLQLPGRTVRIPSAAVAALAGGDAE